MERKMFEQLIKMITSSSVYDIELAIGIIEANKESFTLLQKQILVLYCNDDSYDNSNQHDDENVASEQLLHIFGYEVGDKYGLSLEKLLGPKVWDVYMQLRDGNFDLTNPKQWVKKCK